MNQESRKIKNFTDLVTWQLGHKLVLLLYKISKEFPKDELFGLTNQLRRAAVSFTSNIAEGFSRTSYKEKAQFYAVALGSLTEIQNQLIIAKDLNYIDDKEFTGLEEQIIVLNKMTNGLIKKSKSMLHAS